MKMWREHARLLLTKAKDDAFMMHQLHGHPKAPRWGVGFHAQQAVEKAIKSVLASAGVAFPFTHDLTLLINLLRANDLPLPTDVENLHILTAFATVFRYDAIGQESELDPLLEGQQIPDLIEHTLAWAESIVNQDGPSK